MRKFFNEDEAKAEAGQRRGYLGTHVVNGEKRFVVHLGNNQGDPKRGPETLSGRS